MTEAREAVADAGALLCEDRLLEVFQLLGKRWNGVILGVLLQREARFGEIAHAVDGLADRMLADRLQELRRAGLVERRVEEGPPVAVRYALTEKGRAMRPVFTELKRWADDWLGDVHAREPADR